MSKLKAYDKVCELIKNGKPVSKEVELAMKRVPHYIKKYKYNKRYINALISFMERNMYLQKGEHKLIQLQPEQKFWVEMLGFEHPDGRPVITDLPIILGAGSGKSTFLAALALAVMIIGSKRGQDVLVFANSKRQAEELFQTSQNIVKDEDSIFYNLYKENILVPIFHKIRYEATNSTLEIKANDNRTADGVNVRMAIFDEFHAYKNNVIENIRKSTAPKRKETGYTIVYSSTNGQTRGAVFDDYMQKWERILSGEVENDAVFPIIYKMDDISEVTKPELYEKAMPFIKTLSDPQIMLDTVKLSKGDPVAQAEILAKSFNIPQSEYNSLFTDEVLSRSLKGYKPIPKNAEVYIGYDLSAVDDLSAIVFLYKDELDNYYVDGHAFIPSETYNPVKGSRKPLTMEQHDLYKKFVDKGLLTLVPSPQVQGEQVFKYIQDYLYEHHLNTAKILGDNYYSRELKQQLVANNMEELLQEIPQTVKYLSEPLKNINALMQSDKFFIANDILKWNYANLRVRVDANNNVYPNKEKATNKIDLCSASIAAMYGLLHRDDDYKIVDFWSKRK